MNRSERFVSLWVQLTAEEQKLLFQKLMNEALGLQESECHNEELTIAADLRSEDFSAYV